MKFYCYAITYILAMNACLFAKTAAFLDKAAIIEAWESNYATIKTMKVECFEELIAFSAADKESKPVEYQHINRVEDGDCFYTEYSYEKSDSGEPVIHTISSFDGKKTKKLFNLSKAGTISPGADGLVDQKYNPLKEYMLMNNSAGKTDPAVATDFQRWLKYPDSKVLPNLEEYLGYQCHVIEYSSDKYDMNQLCKIYVADEAGMLPLKFQYFRNGEVARELIVEEVAKAESNGSVYWYPKKATKYVKSFGSTYRLNVKSYVPNIKVDKAVYNFEFPDGTKVLDYTAQIGYIKGTTEDIQDVPQTFGSDKLFNNGDVAKAPEVAGAIAAAKTGSKPVAAKTEKQEEPLITKAASGKNNSGTNILTVLKWGAVVILVITACILAVKRK